MRQTLPEGPIDQAAIANRNQHANVYRLVQAFRRYGHREAHTNPLGSKAANNNVVCCSYVSLRFCLGLAPSVGSVAELRLETYGLDPTMRFAPHGILTLPPGVDPIQQMEVGTALASLREGYCRQLGYEFDHLSDAAEIEWFAKRVEQDVGLRLDGTVRRHLLELMIQSATFDKFMQTRFGNVKRYSAEGAEAMFCFLSTMLESCATHGIKEVVMAMPHRGRLNLAVGLMQVLGRERVLER